MPPVKIKASSKYGNIGNPSSSLNNMYMSDFVFSIQSVQGEKEFKVLKNRRGSTDPYDKGVHEYMIQAFVESSYASLCKNKTNVKFFEESIKEKFKYELIEFIESRWKEINQTLEK